MTFACQLTPAEMREAFRLNRTAGTWFRLALVNVRLTVFAGVVIFSLAMSALGHGAVKWDEILGLLGVVVLLAGFRIWRYAETAKKTAAQVNLACANMSIDAGGLNTTGASGASNYVPWSGVQRWKEGALVYTIGEAKAYKVIPKRALTPMQMGELQGYLQMYVRPAGS